MEYFKIICWAECPYCLRSKNLLIEKGEQFEYCSVDHSNELLNYYKKVYNHKTVPIIVKLNTENDNAEFIGGFSELRELFERT